MFLADATRTFLSFWVAPTRTFLLFSTAATWGGGKVGKWDAIRIFSSLAFWCGRACLALNNCYLLNSKIKILLEASLGTSFDNALFYFQTNLFITSLGRVFLRKYFIIWRIEKQFMTEIIYFSYNDSLSLNWFLLIPVQLRGT